MIKLQSNCIVKLSHFSDVSPLLIRRAALLHSFCAKTTQRKNETNRVSIQAGHRLIVAKEAILVCFLCLYMVNISKNLNFATFSVFFVRFAGVGKRLGSLSLGDRKNHL